MISIRGVLGIQRFSYDLVLAGFIAILSIPFWALIPAMLLHVDGAVLAFGYGLFVLVAVSVAPFIVGADILWVVYWILSGSSLFNLKVRKARNREYRRLQPHFLAIALLFIPILLTSNDDFKRFCWFWDRLSTDAEMITHFERHKAEFEELADLVESGKKTSESVNRLVKKLKLKGGVRGNRLLTYFDGWALSGRWKGYIRSSGALAPLYQSLDDDTLDGNTSYRQITSNWYLVYEWY